MEQWLQWAFGVALVIIGAINTNLIWEIRQLRAWRHKIGDDPCENHGMLLDLHDERLRRIEQRLFNGVKR